MSREDTEVYGPKVSFKLLEKGIIENAIRNKANLHVEDVVEAKKENQRISNNKPYCVLVTTEDAGAVTKEARQLMASKEFAEKTVAKAIVVGNQWTKILANLYVRVNQPHVLTKVFEEREDAITWLRKQYEENKYLQN